MIWLQQRSCCLCRLITSKFAEALFIQIDRTFGFTKFLCYLMLIFRTPSLVFGRGWVLAWYLPPNCAMFNGGPTVDSSNFDFQN